VASLKEGPGRLDGIFGAIGQRQDPRSSSGDLIAPSGIRESGFCFISNVESHILTHHEKSVVQAAERDLAALGIVGGEGGKVNELFLRF
jgi:hypothetical protein